METDNDYCGENLYKHRRCPHCKLCVHCGKRIKKSDIIGKLKIGN